MVLHTELRRFVASRLSRPSQSVISPRALGPAQLNAWLRARASDGRRRCNPRESSFVFFHGDITSRFSLGPKDSMCGPAHQSPSARKPGGVTLTEWPILCELLCFARSFVKGWETTTRSIACAAHENVWPASWHAYHGMRTTIKTSSFRISFGGS